MTTPRLSEHAERAALKVVPEATDAADDGTDAPARTVIRVSGTPDAIRKVRRALSERQLPEVYVSDGAPVSVERVSGTVAEAVDDDSPVPVRSVALTPPSLASLLAHHADVRRRNSGGDGDSEWTPPAQALSAVLATSEWPNLPRLAGIVGMPVLRRDGTLLQDQGYDEATGLYLAPKFPLPRIDDIPTAQDVAAARTFVLDRLLGDFEWPAHADRANYLGLLVSPFLRRYLRCLTPLGIITATMPGSGKSILAGLIGLLAGQKTLPWADDEPELRKAITSAFTVEAGAVVFDNLEEGTVIASPILANLLTNPAWSDRILGSTRVGTWANERLWLVTGNNLRVGGDIASRSVLVRLSPGAPHPEQRTGFAIPNLDTWILDPANRATTLRHLLVLILAWTNAGAPADHTLPSMRQFTPWARGVGGLLAFHDVPGFLRNLDDLRASDEEDQKWTAFLSMWQRRHGGRPMRAREVFEDAALDDAGHGGAGVSLDPWDGAFITSARGSRPRTAVQLGQWLAGHDGRFHGDLRLRREHDSHAKVDLWRVESYTPPPRA